MTKEIKIPLETFLKLYKIICTDLATENDLQTTKIYLETKFDALMRHELYTQYKTAPTDKERKAARQKYLDMVGIPENFRW